MSDDTVTNLHPLVDDNLDPATKLWFLVSYSKAEVIDILWLVITNEGGESERGGRRGKASRGSSGGGRQRQWGREGQAELAVPWVWNHDKHRVVRRWLMCVTPVA